MLKLSELKQGKLLFLEVTRVNATRNTIFSETGVYESRYEAPGDIYRSFLGEAGRCTGKVYIDDSVTGEPVQVGWVFQKKKRYSDARRPYTERDYYLEETWVVVHTRRPHLSRVGPDLVNIEYPAILGRGLA